MAGKVKPQNVSPLIKSARYVFLILGCFYGNLRLSSLREYESKARGLRHKMLHEKEQRKIFVSRERSKADIKNMAIDFGVTEFPPGWDDDI